MTPRQPPGRLTFETVHVDSIGRAQWREIADLCTAAFEKDFRSILANLPDTTHVIARVGGRPVSHACWVVRWVQPDDTKPLRTAYVEAVATAPEHQGRGYASAVMWRVATEIAGFELVALSPGIPAFYERLGWERWRGPIAIRTRPQDSAMVLRLPGTPELDLNAPMSPEWRPGEPW